MTSRKEAIRDKREGVLLVRHTLRPGEEPRSYIGGLPRLRKGMRWPVSETGLPFNFIAQIDLRDVPRPRGVVFPAEGLLWFFADFSASRFTLNEHTRVLFDPHPRIVAPERKAPANLPPLELYDQHGWLGAEHPRAFVEPKAGLFMHLFDTFRDVEPSEGEMVNELREEALRRATGFDRTQGGYWYTPRSGYGETSWPATSIDAEYALMRLGRDHRFSIGGKNVRSAKVLADLAARLQGQIRVLRSLGPRPLAPAKRASVLSLIEQVKECLQRSDWDVRSVIERTYPHTAFQIVSTMPDAEKYVPAELRHPYQELMFGNAIYFHQMFGHGSSPQDSPSEAEEADYVLLLQLGGTATLGLPLMGDAAMHYWIPRQDLARGRFDRVVGTWEAG